MRLCELRQWHLLNCHTANVMHQYVHLMLMFVQKNLYYVLDVVTQHRGAWDKGGAMNMTIHGIETFAGTNTVRKKAASRIALWALVWMVALAVGLLLPSALAFADDEGISSASPDDIIEVQADPLQTNATTAKRTIMLYVCGADLEEDSGMASTNLRQVLESNFGSEEDVRFVVMTGGSYRWYLDDDDNVENDNGFLVYPDGIEVPEDAAETGNPIFDEEIVRHNPKSQISGPYNQIWEAKSTGAATNPGKLVLLDGNGLKDHRADNTEDPEWMSDPETLKGFINYCVDNYPAEKYDLILWDHGGGPTGGFALDIRREQSWFASNTMTFAQILDALKNNKVTNLGDDNVDNDGTFDFVNFDACLMGSTEITLGIADYTDYYIASPETVPGRGQVYTGWLNKLGEDPNANTFDLGRKLVDDFNAYYDAGYEDGTRQEATMALIDMNALLNSGFVDALSTVGATLRSQIEEGQFYDEMRSVKGSIVYEGGVFYDLGNLISQLGVSLWELEPDAVDSQGIDYSSAYTDAASTLLGILSNPDIVYASCTSGMSKESRFFLGAEAQNNTLRSSGLHLYFPPAKYEMGVSEYDAEIQDAVAVMPEDSRAEFLKNHVQAMYEFNLIRIAGRAVTQMVNDGYKQESINYDKLIEYWKSPTYPDYPDLWDYNYYSSNYMPLVDAMGTDEGTIKSWLDGIVQQQAREAVSADNVTAISFVTRGGTGSKVTIENTRRRAVDGVWVDVVAELPAVRTYIEEHDAGLGEDGRTYSFLIENGQANLPIGSISASMDASMDTIDDSSGDFLHDYVTWFNSATSTTWNVDPVERNWYAIEDADGNFHVATVEEASLTTTVPMIRLRNGQIGDDPELNLLGFTDGKLTQIYLHDEEGNARIIRASDLKTEMEFVPALYVSGFVSLVLPASQSSFKVAPGNINNINLVITDVSNIPDIADVDGDGDAFGFKYTVSDIYGSKVDITKQVTNPLGQLIDIRLAEVQPATYTGKELKPVVTYNGRTLVEGVDYVLENDSGRPFVEPGEYDITIWGIGDYVEFQLATFVINPADKSEPTDPYKIETREGAPVIDAKNMADVANATLTKEELDAGYALLLVSSPLAEEEVPEADKVVLSAKSDEIGAAVGTWFDISLYKVRGEERVKLSEVPAPIQMTVQVPESLRKDGRTFYLLHCHDGEAAVVAEGAGPELSWEGDKFSTYAIGYKDAEELGVEPDSSTPEPSADTPASPDASGTPGSSESSGTSGSSGASGSSSTTVAPASTKEVTVARTPNTGDPLIPASIACAAAFFGAAAAFLLAFRKA